MKTWCMIFGFDSIREYSDFMNILYEIRDSAKECMEVQLQEISDIQYGPVMIDVDDIDIDELIDNLEQSYEYFVIWSLGEYKLKKYGLSDITE